MLLRDGKRSGGRSVCGAINDGPHQGAKRWKRTVMNNRNKRESIFLETKIAAKIVKVNFDGDKAIYGSCTENSISKNHIKLNLKYQKFY